MRSRLLVQISDVHLTVDGELMPGVRPRDNLLRGLSQLESAGLRPDVFLLSGDLADAGDGSCYDDLAAILGDAARRSGASVVCLPGNHDDRLAFRRHLLGAADGDPAGSGVCAAGRADDPVNQTVWRDGLRIIALDSTIPGEAGGALSERTLGYLRSELATPAPDGTIVALHHPPIPSPVEPMSRIALREPERLRDAIVEADVRIVLCGHYHHAALGMLGPTPVWVAPATAYRADTTSGQVFRKLPGSAFTRVDLSGASPLVSIIPVG
jgi:3',5'-cyclic-AMP phosphodiesterase